MGNLNNIMSAVCCGYEKCIGLWILRARFCFLTGLKEELISQKWLDRFRSNFICKNIKVTSIMHRNIRLIGLIIVELFKFIKSYTDFWDGVIGILRQGGPREFLSLPAHSKIIFICVISAERIFAQLRQTIKDRKHRSIIMQRTWKSCSHEIRAWI